MLHLGLPETCGDHQGGTRAQRRLDQEILGWKVSWKKKRGPLRGRKKQSKFKTKACIAFWILTPNELANLLSCGFSQVISAIASDDCYTYLCHRGRRHFWRNVGFNICWGEGWKKNEKWPPTLERHNVSCLVPFPSLCFLPPPPPTHTLIKRTRISSYAILGNRKSRRCCNWFAILVSGMNPICWVQQSSVNFLLNVWKQNGIM